MTPGSVGWPYLPVLARLALALAIGLLVGIERERQRKEAGVRTFAFASLLGAVGGLLGDPFALAAVGLLGVLVVLLNVETIRTGEGAEITTSAALLLMGFAGVLAGQGHTFTPTAIGIAATALLAWKKPLAGFTHGLTEGELRSAVLLAIIAFIVYPVLPTTSVDPWHLIYPRDAWITVVLIASLGFVSYILLKLYGERGIELTGFLGGLVNSTVTTTELATRARAASGRFRAVAYRGVLLATAAMLIRNAVILGLLAPAALLAATGPLAFMIAGTIAAVLLAPPKPPESDPPGAPADAPLTTMESPFSLTSALKFGLVFLALQVAGTLANRFLGRIGFYGVSVIGGLVSSASAVASAANLARSDTIPPHIAAIGAVAASAASALIDLPLVARVGHDPVLTRRLAWVVAGVILLGALGLGAQLLVLHYAHYDLAGTASSTK
jgi:uncharacterized membrane protein (DUF4010 family)